MLRPGFALFGAGPGEAPVAASQIREALRSKITLAFVATALMAVLVSYLVAAMIPGAAAAALLAMVIAGALGAGIGYTLGGTFAQSLSDLAGVILRFVKWDMDGVVPYVARPDEVGAIEGAEVLPFRRDQMEREPQIRAGQPGPGPACIPAAHRGADPPVPRLDRRHSRRVRGQRADDGRDGARSRRSPATPTSA